MNRREKVFLVSLVVGICPALALAEVSLVDWVRQQVDQQLVKPLSEHRAVFSRRRPPPRESRVRVLQTTPSVDKDDKHFVPFAVDLRAGSEWDEDMTGCIYRADAQIFVKRGDEYRPVAYMLGQNVEAVKGACEPATNKPSS